MCGLWYAASVRFEVSVTRTVAVVGSRDWRPAGWVEHEELSPFAVFELLLLDLLKPGDTVISGGARGPDTWAILVARNCNFPVVEILADWDTHGKKAGMLRNSEVVARSDWVIAFWDGKSRGTRDTIGKAHKTGCRVTVIFPDGRVRENWGDDADQASVV